MGASSLWLVYICKGILDTLEKIGQVSIDRSSSGSFFQCWTESKRLWSRLSVVGTSVSRRASFFVELSVQQGGYRKLPLSGILLVHGTKDLFEEFRCEETTTHCSHSPPRFACIEKRLKTHLRIGEMDSGVDTGFAHILGCNLMNTRAISLEIRDWDPLGKERTNEPCDV